MADADADPRLGERHGVRAARSLIVGVVLLTSPGLGLAQVRASERGSVAQIIDGTRLEVSFGRPRLRGRTAFGGLVAWGEMWTPGANWATTFTATRSVRLGGHEVPAGSYSIWFAPTETGWTVYLNARARRYHLERPKPTEMFLAIPVTPETVPTTDLLTFSFPETRRNGATLRFQWGTVALSLPIDVAPTAPERPLLTARQVAPYLGTYAAWIFAEQGDSTAMRIRLGHEHGRLAGQIDDGPGRFELFPTGKPRQFWFETHDAEGPRDVELDGPVTFTLGPDGRATGFRMPGIEQPVWLRGARTSP